MSIRTRTAALLLFGSGFCALVYQTAWLREFRLIFGASTAASAAVLGVFMAGLGFGGIVYLLVNRMARMNVVARGSFALSCFAREFIVGSARQEPLLNKIRDVAKSRVKPSG